MSDAALADAAQADASFTPVSVHVPPRPVVHASPAPTASAANCIIADPEGTVLAAASSARGARSTCTLALRGAPPRGARRGGRRRARRGVGAALLARATAAVNEVGPRAARVGRSGVYRSHDDGGTSTVRKSGYDSVRFVEATGECLRLFGSERSERADSSEARILGSAESIGSISRSIASGLAIATGSKKANADEFENMRSTNRRSSPRRR